MRTITITATDEQGVILDRQVILIQDSSRSLIVKEVGPDVDWHQVTLGIGTVEQKGLNLRFSKE